MHELCEGEPACGSSGSIRCQIARYDLRSTREQRPEIPTATQIGGLIDDRGWVALKVGISAGCIGNLGSRRMAVIASGHGIDEVAAEPDQFAVLTPKIQRHGGDFQSPCHLRVI